MTPGGPTSLPDSTLAPVPAGPAVAVVVCRDGSLHAGADEATAEAGGRAVVAGTGAEQAAHALVSAHEVWWSDGAGGPAAWAALLAPALAPVHLVILPASPDGRDLGPRLAAELGRPLLAGAVEVEVDVAAEVAVAGATVRAHLLRVDGRVVVPVSTDRPAVATLLPGARSAAPASFPAGAGPLHHPLHLGQPGRAAPDPQVLALIEPDPATMDLADATRVLGGGAGLVPRGATDAAARATFALLAEVAAALGASMGATRVVTDAGWTGPERQIGTTGVAIDPELYVAFGVSGATQHTGGLGAPRHVVSLNTDPACPMTALADLGLVADAHAVLLGLAERLGVPLPPELTGPTERAGAGATEAAIREESRA